MGIGVLARLSVDHVLLDGLCADESIHLDRGVLLAESMSSAHSLLFGRRMPARCLSTAAPFFSLAMGSQRGGVGGRAIRVLQPPHRLLAPTLRGKRSSANGAQPVAPERAC